MEALYYVGVYRDYMVVSMGCVQISVVLSVLMRVVCQSSKCWLSTLIGAEIVTNIVVPNFLA